MAYLCPLCLQALTSSDKLEFRCARHPTVWHQTSGIESAPRFCSERGCDSGRHLGYNDLFCRHLKCNRGKNPFWDGNTVSVKDKVVVLGSNSQETVTHWQVALLKDLEKCAYPDMWFPSRLLVPVDRATRRRGRTAMVSLCGAKNVGKTYLAMHALDTQGVDTAKADFIYCYPSDMSEHNGSTASTEFLETLRLREVMQGNEDFSQRLRSTESRPRNLKVSFFVPSVTGRFRWLRKLVQTLEGSVHSLMLYDISGEAAEKSFDRNINEHDQHMDVVAVVISAEDIPGGVNRTSANSLGPALVRLRDMSARQIHGQIRCALLVTKGDKWAGQSGTKLTPALVKTSLSAAMANPSATELLGYLTGADRVVGEIFVTYPDDPNIQAPIIVGLNDFAQWCFS